MTKNEIEPGKLFAGYSTLAVICGNQSAMPGLQKKYDFEVAESGIGSLVRDNPAPNSALKLGQP